MRERRQIFEKDPEFATDYADALNILNDPEKLATPGLNGDWVYNQWRDAEHLRGLLRRTTLADYLTASPKWQPVLDIDELNRAENAKWVSRGVNCLYPGDEYCVAVLSNGGEDATTAREFNLKQAKFVSGGFVLDHSKQNIGWEDKDTLLVARDWGAGTLTGSGYPFVVKRWKRGTPLDSASEVFRGKSTDELGSSANVIHDASGHQARDLRSRRHVLHVGDVCRNPEGDSAACDSFQGKSCGHDRRPLAHSHTRGVETRIRETDSRGFAGRGKAGRRAA